MEKAKFALESYSFDEFEFNSSNNPKEDTSIKIDPSGVLETKSNKYFLVFDFYAFDENVGVDKPYVKCKLQALFNFSEEISSIDDVPPYFYANSIAIVFPYLRSFISSLTIQANIRPVILPTMNLGSLSSPLKENTVVK